MHQFQTCLDQWIAADREALSAEQRLGRRLDLYCSGTGAAPPLADIAQAAELRGLASDDLKILLGLIRETRERLPLI